MTARRRCCSRVISPIDLGLDPDDVVLATREQLGYGIPAWLQMSDAETAQERRRSWRRRARPTIVACSLPPGARGLRWAREILDDLEPTITWAIVDAGAKREDIALPRRGARRRRRARARQASTAR